MRRFKVGDNVLVFKPVTKKGKATRFLYTWDGPFVVIEAKDNNINYVLTTRNGGKSRPYHIGNLKRYTPSIVEKRSDAAENEEEAEEEDDRTPGEREWTVQTIKNKRIIEGKVEYSVKWYGYKKTSWVPLEQMTHCSQMIQRYEDKQQAK